jgi:hypothetical protein
MDPTADLHVVEYGHVADTDLVILPTLNYFIVEDMDPFQPTIDEEGRIRICLCHHATWLETESLLKQTRPRNIDYV